jgi:hypothetical protein
MLLFDEAAVILDDLIEELPEGIYDELNGGVNLIEEAKKNEYGDYIMGLYHNDEMGRYIEIFYGSFAELYGDMDQDEFTEELRKVLHHELTHHVENLAGDRTLEKWDEEQEEKRKYGYVDADSIAFVDDDGTALAPMAAAMLRKYSAGRCEDVRCAAVCLEAFPGKYNADALKAADALGVTMLGAPAPLQARDMVLKDYGAILCMTMDQANAVYTKFPQFDEKIMCLGVTDIKEPFFKRNWGKTAERMKELVEDLVDELCEENS